MTYVARQHNQSMKNHILMPALKQVMYSNSHSSLERMYYRVYLSSGAYTVSAADAEDAAWQGLALSKDLTAFLIDVEPIYDLKETVLPKQLEEIQGCT